MASSGYVLGFSGTAWSTEDAGEVGFSAGNCIAHPSIMCDPSISRDAFWVWDKKLNASCKHNCVCCFSHCVVAVCAIAVMHDDQGHKSSQTYKCYFSFKIGSAICISWAYFHSCNYSQYN